MTEIQISIKAPELTEAINALAEAIATNHINPTAPTQQAPAAPVNPTTPVPGAPLSATPAQSPAPATFGNAVPVVPTAPAQQAPVAPVQQAAPAVPTAAPQYTLEMIATAGSALIDAGKLDQLMALLGKYGVDSLTNLAPENYGAIAQELRALGARI